jgi:hypothetical protein
MIRSFLLVLALVAPAGTIRAAESGKALTDTYQAWRRAILARDFPKWQSLTAPHRQREVRNRILSEKGDFPGSLFELPAPPPSLEGLRCLHVSEKGPTAKAAYFGKVDFGVGGTPTENLLVLSFVGDKGRWTYDKADFVNLAALPDVRRELAAGKLDYLKQTPECQASGAIPPMPPAVPKAKYIAKVYVFCPGREVVVQVNRLSEHRFANAKEAEIILGGARDGRNLVSFTAKPLEGGTGREAFAVRVYLMSEIPGTKPIIAYEYKAEEGQPVKPLEHNQFMVDAETAENLIP